MSPRRALAAALLPCVALALLAGIAGGLLRVGVAWPSTADAAWLTRAAVFHAALIMCGFMGTVIATERAVAAGTAAAWLAPLASGAAAIALLSGAQLPATILLVTASTMFVGVNVFLLRKQTAPHTGLLLLGAAAWFVGNVLLAAGADASAVVPWWFAFLVVTIAAERLEMTRLMRRRPGAQPTLYLLLAAMAAGAVCSATVPLFGGVVFGAALCGLAAWLLAFDIARRTVKARGLSRYMAVCLLGGYSWLAIGGAAWVATALGRPARDAALHAIGLGFIVSMIMGHAPVILPAVTRIKVQFGSFFYVPLAALHVSLALRLFAGAAQFQWRAQGAVFNALAIALFAATSAGAAFAWRRRREPRRITRHSP